MNEDGVRSESPDHNVGKVLNDEQWAILAKLGTLPAEARSDIEGYVYYAGLFFAAEQPSAQQRRRRAIREAADLAARLQRLAAEISESNVLCFEGLEDEKGLLEPLKDFEEKMRARIKNFKTGPVTDGFHFVVQSINFTLIKYAKRTLNLSEKKSEDGYDATEFLVKFFEFAGYPNKGTGLRSKVRNAIKEVVEIMRRWEPEYRPGFSPRTDLFEAGLRGGWMFFG